MKDFGPLCRASAAVREYWVINRLPRNSFPRINRYIFSGFLTTFTEKV
jgi:hypothetical protein